MKDELTNKEKYIRIWRKTHADKVSAYNKAYMEKKRMIHNANQKIYYAVRPLRNIDMSIFEV